jgi:3-methyl-2-oxobutanoate hydroxymethyltransferase
MSLTTFSSERSGTRVGREADRPTKVTVPSLLQKKLLRQPITAVTAYDYASARLVDEAGLDVVLVGDSLAMVMQGHENTLAVTMDEMLLSDGRPRGCRQRSPVCEGGWRRGSEA